MTTLISLSTSTTFKFNALHKPNQLICGTGQTAIVTGWTVKQAVAKHLHPNEYAVIGQLYSPTRGISFLIRNLLFNPHIHYLIALNATREDFNSGAVRCLIDFFTFGFKRGFSDTGRECWIIKSNITGYIDIEIPESDLEKLRKLIEVKEVKEVKEALFVAKGLAGNVLRKPWGFPREYYASEVAPTVLPGHLYGHRIEGQTIAQTWVKIIHRIKTTGTIRPTGYDGKWQELIDLMAVVTDEPDGFYFPEPNYLPCSSSFVENYLGQILDDAPYQEGVKYTYGQRLRSWFKRDQIEQVINKLIGEIDAASAVMNLWDVQDHEKGGSPCLNHIWLRVVDNELSLTATFRSNDMFSAWPSNAMGLRALQRHIRDEIARRSDCDLKMGALITISQSAHIYDDCWENADNLIKRQYNQICKLENQAYSDSVGNFLIEVIDSKIIISQTTLGSGEIVACYSGKNPLKLISEICAASPGISPSHAGYLGMELQKAADCLKYNVIYVQDR